MKPSKDTARLDTHVDFAEAKFWSKVASEYPEIKTGDLSPETAFNLTRAMREAIAEWLVTNEVDEDDDVYSNSTTIMLHNIEYFYREHDMELTPGDEEHIAYCISQGISEGELCTIPEGQDEEVWGYWGINNCQGNN